MLAHGEWSLGDGLAVFGQVSPSPSSVLSQTHSSCPADCWPSPLTEDSFLYALSSNNAWASYKAHQNPEFFHKLASGQAPEIRKLSPSQPTYTNETGSTPCRVARSCSPLCSFALPFRSISTSWIDVSVPNTTVQQSGSAARTRAAPRPQSWGCSPAMCSCIAI